MRLYGTVDVFVVKPNISPCGTQLVSLLGLVSDRNEQLPRVDAVSEFRLFVQAS